MLSSQARIVKIVVACVVAACVGLVGAFRPALAETRPTKYPTISQIKGLVADGSRMTSIPTGQIFPGIGVDGPIDFVAAHPNWVQCLVSGDVVDVTTQMVTDCTFGDPSATQIIGVYGDSNSRMWAPALDLYGEQTHRRVVVLGHVGCTTWPRPWAPATATLAGAITERDCVRWRANVLATFRRMKVSIVLPISIDNAGVHDYVRPTKVINSLTLTILDIRRRGMKPILLAPVPSYRTNGDYVNCLSVHRDTLGDCMIATKDVTNSRLGLIYAAVSSALSVPMVSTTDLFCTTERCPVFVTWEGRTIQIYRDGLHITPLYAQLISGVLGPRVTTAQTQAR